VGDTSSYAIDVWIVSSSNRDIKSLIQQGLFREDLYYRLKVIDIELPPLRERKEDIPLLVGHFIEKFSREMKRGTLGVSEKALRILLDYAWPGNVRELENVIQRAITLSGHEMIQSEDLPHTLIQGTEENIIEKSLQEKYTIEQLVNQYIKKVLIEVGGNKSKAAEILGLDRKTLYRKLQEE
jgi:transcriptional regulator with PAS, ATPase and Fis domain